MSDGRVPPMRGRERPRHHRPDLTPSVRERYRSPTASEELGEHCLTLDNYLPATIPPERDERWIGYVSHPSATPHLGNLRFEQWWAWWLALNAVARFWVRDYQPPESSDAGDRVERERLRLWAESENLGMIEVDRTRLREAVLSANGPVIIHPGDEYDAFVASLTWRSGVQKPDSSSRQPSSIPPARRRCSGDPALHWRRSSGLARRPSRGEALGEHAGKYFEDRVHAALSKHPAVIQLRSDVLLQGTAGGQGGVQIDHGFVTGTFSCLSSPSPT